MTTSVRNGSARVRPAPRKSKEARAEILKAAAEAMAERGFHGMSMRDLARATRRAPASFYNHFSSKDDLLFALQSEAFEALISSLDRALSGCEEPVARLYIFLLNHLRYVHDHPQIMRILIHEASALPAGSRQAVRALKERYFEVGRGIVREIVLRGCRHGATPGESRRADAVDMALDAAELERATYAVFGMINWTWGWYRPELHGPPSVVARTIHRLALCGLVARCPYGPLQDDLDRQLRDLDPAPLILGKRIQSAAKTPKIPSGLIGGA